MSVDDHWAVMADDLATGHSSTVETGRRRLTRGPRHFLPTVPDSVGLVADQLDPGALAIRLLVDDVGRRLFWYASAFAVEQRATDTTPWTTTTVDGVAVRPSARSPLGADRKSVV